MGDPEDLVTSTEAAVLLLRSTATVSRWAHDGRLPVAAKAPGIRGAFLFRRKDIEAVRDELAARCAGVSR